MIPDLIIVLWVIARQCWPRRRPAVVESFAERELRIREAHGEFDLRPARVPARGWR